MKTRIALFSVLVVVVFVWFLRGAPNPLTIGRLGAGPTNVETPYKFEHEWAIREIAADVSEIAAYGSARSDVVPAIDETIAPWHPDLLVSYAAKQIGPVGDPTSDMAPPEQHEGLLAMSVDAILESSAAVSSALKNDMKNARAHEAAALTVAAFALRESAEGLSDTRWALNRMTAHLAVAQAIRHGAPPVSVDGELAEVALLALADRHKTALAALETMAASTPAASAWQRALRMRVTQDWKVLDEPATASRLEKLEYFRARRATLRGTRAGQDLADMDEGIAADFARIAAGRSLGVEDGSDFIDEGLTNEVAEMKHAYWQMHKRQLPKVVPADIVNERAGRLLAHGEPQVIPWGAWAEFGNRHVGMWAMKADYHYRHMLANPDEADQLNRVLDQQYGDWTMYPVASMGRTKGKRGTEADMSQIDRAIDVAIRAPELVSFDYWAFIENGVHYEPVKRGMPKRTAWFSAPSADVPYDIALRAEFALGSLKPADVEMLMDEARHSNALLSRVALRHRTNQQLTAKVRELTGARAAYDLYAVDLALNSARDADDRIALRRQACALSVSQCLSLAAELAATDEAAAAAEYEKAFSDPALDAVAMTWSSRWLVNYYERTNRPAKATALAERSAGVGSAQGMLTLALLHEGRSQFDEAEQLFSSAASRYPDRMAPLAAFLYRQAVVRKKPEYLDRWTAIERELFRGGVQPTAVEMKTRPANGVFVEKDSYWSRTAGLRAGDIIVGIDGLKVENFAQLDAVLWFKPEAKTYQFTAWRGVLFTADIPTNHGMTLKTHPLKGWIE